jgi:hypothetical protein
MGRLNLPNHLAVAPEQIALRAVRAIQKNEGLVVCTTHARSLARLSLFSSAVRPLANLEKAANRVNGRMTPDLTPNPVKRARRRALPLVK